MTTVILHFAFYIIHFTFIYLFMSYQFIQTASEQEFVEQSVKQMSDNITKAIEDRGGCILGLCGGSTPRPIYDALGKADLDWEKVSLFLVDERYVPPEHSESNQHLIRETLLAHAAIPEEQCVFPNTNLPIDECIAVYTERLKTQWKDYLPDIITLGLGEDGHIASLFPPLSENLLDDTQLVAHTETNQFTVHDRITLTLNPLAAASTAIFFLKGEGKKRVWEEMLAGLEDERRWPAKRILEQEKVTVVAL